MMGRCRGLIRVCTYKKGLRSLKYAPIMKPCTRNRVHLPGGTGLQKVEQVMKYQLADLNNGPFGDVYESVSDAEKALAEVIAEGQAFNDEHAQECEDAGCEVPSAADFFSIVEVVEA